MGDIAEQVAQLELMSVSAKAATEEARTALELAERVGEEVEGRIDDIEAVREALFSIHSELDTHIAENNYPAVEQNAYQLQGLINDRELYRTIDIGLQMAALHDGTPIPSTSIEHRIEELHHIEARHPTLTQQDLDQHLGKAVQQAEAIWGDVPDRSDDDDRATFVDEARREAISDRALLAGRHLMELCDYIAETLWPDVTDGLRIGDLDRIAAALKAAVIAADTAPAAYKLYEVCLAAQYEDNPYSLGAVGEQVTAFESWLRTQSSD
jgi:rubrerythrin